MTGKVRTRGRDEHRVRVSWRLDNPADAERATPIIRCWDERCHCPGDELGRTGVNTLGGLITAVEEHRERWGLTS